MSLFTLLEPKTHISKPKIQNACLVNYCHHALSKNSFSKFEGLSCFHIGPWSYFAKNANKFEMLLLVIFSIIPKLSLFLFEIPILPRSLLKKKKKYRYVGEEFLYTLCSLLVNCKKPKRRIALCR